MKADAPVQRTWMERQAELSDLATERHLLASIMLYPQAIDKVSQMVSMTDFFDADLGQAFAVTVDLHRAGRPVSDPALVYSAWKASAVSSSVANIKYVAALINEVPHGGHAIYYAENVASLSMRRKLLNLADEIGRSVLDRQCKAEELPLWLDGKVKQLPGTATSKARPIADVWTDAIGELQGRVSNPEPSVLLSGFPAADARGFVFGNGELAVLAARPGVGKTSMATQIAMHHAGKGRAVLFASLEMRDKELALRPLVAAAGHNHQLLRTNRIDQELVNDLRSAKETLGDIPLHVWSPGRVKASAIHAVANLLKASSDLRLLVVDYIGLVRPDDNGRQRYEQVGQIVKSLRDIGQQLQIPVLALCQLNREADSQEPRLANLRESGDIEQDADVVAFLNPCDAKDETQVDLIVAKDRHGAIGRARLIWHKEQTVFEDPTIPKRHDDFDKFNREGF
ncbi:MAG TPA: DnaB-like helicase C-terminal domain-containing protein [Pirellulaceae bacterium]|nr:DnaB-like helicase C-terminal domain-containing protein [Pirellulaceae bacterium]